MAEQLTLNQRVRGSNPWRGIGATPCTNSHGVYYVRKLQGLTAVREFIGGAIFVAAIRTASQGFASQLLSQLLSEMLSEILSETLSEMLS